jgi:sugar phosphate permease
MGSPHIDLQQGGIGLGIYGARGTIAAHREFGPKSDGVVRRRQAAFLKHSPRRLQRLLIERRLPLPRHRMMRALLLQNFRGRGGQRHGSPEGQLSAKCVQDGLRREVSRGLIGIDRILRDLPQAAVPKMVGPMNRHCVEPLHADGMERRKSRRIVFRDDFGNCGDLVSLARLASRQQPQDADPGRRRVNQPVAILDLFERVRFQRPMDSFFNFAGHIDNSFDPSEYNSEMPTHIKEAPEVILGAAGPAISVDRERTRALRTRQTIVVLLLFGGYGALYFCRADLSVATPLLVEELVRHGISHADAIIRMGSIASFGVLAYALGKIFLTGLGDFWGGRINFLIGLGGATLFTLMFASGLSLPLFTMAWIGNRLTQSISWAGLIKVSSKWFDFSSYGMIIGILSISYLVGDAAARQWMGMLIEHGFGWRTLFYFAAAVVALFLVVNFFFLRESRLDAGFVEAKPNPLNLFAASESRPQSVRELLLPLVRSRAFLLVCLLSLGCTIIRESFNFWTPVYLRDYLGYSMSNAARMSAVFPGVGAVSVLATGWLSDRLGVNGRSLIMFVGLGATAAALLVLMTMRSSSTGPLLPLIAIGTIAFCLLGPYSYLGGAIALDFGGKQAGAVSSGIIDGVGYLGAVVAGDSIARVSVAFGWQGVFVALAAVSALAAIGAGCLYLVGAKAAARGKHLP